MENKLNKRLSELLGKEVTWEDLGVKFYDIGEKEEELKQNAINIVDEIERDIKMRLGLRDPWATIEDDIKKEIKDCWVGIIQKRLRSP